MLHRFGGVDICVANHARSHPDAGLGELTAEVLDGHWAVDARSVIPLVQAFAGAHQPERGAGRVVLLSSGQQLGPMPGEIAYAAAKAALAGVTATLADELADRGITLNTVNPGPVDTGYTTPRSPPASPPGAGASPTTRHGSSPGCAPTTPPGSPARSSTPKAATADKHVPFHR